MKAFTAVLMMMLASTVSGAHISGPEIYFLQKGHPSWEKVNRLPIKRDDTTVPFGPNGELVNIPPMMLKDYFYPISSLPDEAVIRLFCGENSDHIGCEYFVNLYHCPGCSHAINGGLPGSMTAAGYQGGSCAPGFTVPDVSGAFVQPMVAFRVLVEAGDYVALPELVNDAKHIAIFGSQSENACKYRPLSSCDEPGICTVDDGKCVPAHFCHKMTGPRPKGPDARICPRHCLGFAPFP
eukprot:TRINITY_DN2265_c0_g1_i1.p1 TRINITY_DN2265_c0_g1~~TRINITY_DN2265_c0_g1_i1.p1  ORF type:complete len:258 (+),score=46.69 TRINITY_DN2265_c0_g1_i1:62-775(+)